MRETMADAHDPDMARAIALSLGEEDPILKAGPEIIDLDADNEQTSFGPKTPSQLQPSLTSHNDEARKSGVQRDTSDFSTYTPTSFGIAGLDRKKMEEERLARKRKATDSAPASPTKKNVKASSVTTSSDEAASANVPPSSESSTLQYPHGTVKKTWVAGHARAGDDITLEEVLQAEDLDVALLSSFQWNLQWVLSKLRPETQVGLVMQAKDENEKDRARAVVSSLENRTIQFCFPSMDGQINCMHSKLMLLSHVNHLRIAVPTANLVRYDWGETGAMENSVFLIDLPRFYPRQRVAEEDMPPFAKDLTRFLTAQSLPASIIASLRLFDFSATRPYAFVHTIGGAHVGSDAYNTTGWPGLATAITRLGLHTTAPISLNFITSSVGSLNIDFLSRIYSACQGKKASASPSTTTTSKKALAPSPSSTTTSNTTDEKQIKSHFRLYFPTHETVRSSTARSAGTICMQRSYWTNEKFPKEIMRDCASMRPGCLMHNKIIFVRPTDDGDGDAKKAWAYIGSANCSESAWGNKLVKDKATKTMKLNARNWECGVVVPVVLPQQEEGKEDEEEEEDEREGEATVERGKGLEVFEGRVPVPMSWPGEEYRDRTPWFFMEQG